MKIVAIILMSWLIKYYKYCNNFHADKLQIRIEQVRLAYKFNIKNKAL